MRAANNAGARRGRKPPRPGEANTNFVIGVNGWGPNINIARDPRWGRNPEVPSEDSFLAGKVGAAMTRGIQGQLDQQANGGQVDVPWFAAPHGRCIPVWRTRSSFLTKPALICAGFALCLCLCLCLWWINKTPCLAWWVPLSGWVLTFFALWKQFPEQNQRTVGRVS